MESHWLHPSRVLAQTDAGHMKLVFATRLNLVRLARYRTVAEALDTAAREAVVTVMPEMLRTDAGPMLRIPLAAGYGAELFPAIDAPAI